MKIKMWPIVVLACVLFPGTTKAADSERFREGGVIASFDRQTGTLVVEDSGYRLSPTLRVYSQSGQLLSVETLRRGTKIRFNLTTREGIRGPVITEILVIPGN